MHVDRVRLAVLVALYGCALASERAPGAEPGPAPVHTGAMRMIERGEIDRSGLVSLAELLEQLTITSPTVGTRYNGGGNGSALVDLRGLEASRTLVLIDGRRDITTLGGAADLSTIPLAAVERIEISTGAGSIRRGADAVAGVVNVVLRQRHDGATMRGQLGEYAEGDGRVAAYDFTIGSGGDRAEVLLNASYAKQEPVFAGDRAETAVPLFGFPGNDTLVGASSTTPFGRFGFGAAGNRLPNGTPGNLTLIPGRPGGTAGDFRPFDARVDGYNFAPEQYLSTPYERTALFARARYALADAVDFSTSVLASERRSDQRFAGLPILAGVVAVGPLRPGIPASALHNPFGAAVTRAQFRALEPRRFRQDVDSFRFTTSVDGRFDAWERPWTWSIGYVYADAERRDLALGLLDANRLRDGLGPSFRDATGVARCGTPIAPIAGCVPLDIFHGPHGFTREMLDYASVVPQDTYYREQHQYDATLTGALFALPAGTVDVALGYEYRREAGFDSPDALVASGVAGIATRQPTRGGFSADDTWIAFNVPILADAPLADAFDLGLGARRSDYSSFGETTNAHFTFHWRPFADVVLRGAYGESFRAPSIAELFERESIVFLSHIDPCAGSQRPTGDVLSRCRAGFGGIAPVPPGYEQVARQYRFIVGGNPDLGPERGSARTLGLRYAPSAAPTLEVWLDWTGLEIDDVVGRATMTQLLHDCYVGANLRSCRPIVRTPGGDPDDSFAGNINLPSSENAEVWDIGARYASDVFESRVSLQFDASYLADFHRDAMTFHVPWASARQGANRAGTALDRGLEYPRVRANLTLDAQLGDRGASITVRHRDAVDTSCAVPRIFGRPELCTNPAGNPQFPNGETSLDAVTYVDLQARWDAPWRARVTLGVRNALDESPPLAPDASDGAILPGYDLPGRFWYVGYAQSF